MGKFTGASVIVTALRETDSLRRAINIVLDTCHHEDICEIIIALAKISTQDCVRTAEDICKNSGDVKIRIMFQKRPFIGGAFKDAFDTAEGSHVVMLAADMDTDPAVVCKFIEKSKLFPDSIITASRWNKGGGFVGYSKVKKVCNFIFNHVFSVVYNTKLSDITYGFRLIPTELARSINWEETKHPFYMETALKPIRLGIDFVEVPAVWRASDSGESVNSFAHNFAYFKPVIKNRFIRKEDILKK